MLFTAVLKERLKKTNMYVPQNFVEAMSQGRITFQEIGS
jgi:hypothetical protein